jgi:hypothetical protein
MNDVNLKFTKQDKSLLDNLIRMLGRAKLELEGVEVLVAADSMRWLSRLQKQVEEEASKPPMQVTSDAPIMEPVKKKGSK